MAVGVSDPEAAAEFYQRVLGYRLIQARDGWIEMSTGDIRLFLTGEEVQGPILKLDLPERNRGLAFLNQNGFKRHVFDAADTRLFMRDPFGQVYEVRTLDCPW